MTQKSFIALVLTGLFLMNLTVTHLGGVIQLASGEEIARSSSFCPKSVSVKAGDEASMLASATTNPSLEIPVFCNSYFDFKVESFSIPLIVEDYFKTYVFNDDLYSHVFSERYYLPPRV